MEYVLKYLLKYLRNWPDTKYSATGLTHEFRKLSTKPTMRSACHQPLYSSRALGFRKNHSVTPW